VITYDYLLKRDYGDEVKTFVPDKIPTALPNLVYIEGPNSSGKSTLLNIMALGFHGLKKDRLNIALKNKLSDLVNSDHQKLKFEVEITNSDGSVKLVSKKETFDGEIIVHETVNGKTSLLTPEAFHRKYNLIYDIPDNPTDRLNQLVYEIRDIQKMYGNRLGSFRNYLVGVIGEIRRGRDPKRLEDLKGLIARGTADLSKMNEELDADETFLDRLEKYHYARIYVRKVVELASLEEEITRIEGRIKKNTGKRVKTDKRIQEQTEKVRKLLNGMRESHQMAASLLEPFLPKDERHHLDLWSRLDIIGALEIGEVTQSLDSEILALKRILVKQFNPTDERKDLAEAKIYNDLIEFLNSYRNSDVMLPGDKTIDEFIGQLEEASKRHRDLKVKAENYERVNKLLDELRENRRQANKMLADLHKLRDTYSGDEDSIVDEGDEKELERLTGKRGKLAESCEYARMECAKKEINDSNVQEVLNEMESMETLAPFLLYDDVQLGNAVDDKRKDVLAKQKTIKAKSDTVRLHRQELSRQEKLEPHKYQERLSDLEALLQRIQKLEQKLTMDYGSKIDALIEKKVDKKGRNDEYFQEVAKYLGKRVGYIRHLEESYKVEKIDLLEGNILTVSGKKIRLTDMGTGQSQSAYLTGLLNTDDKRKIIAIFDEVAMMDSSSLEPIYRKFNELYEVDRLLTGVVVQKGDTVKIVSKIEA
jgi:exonuclease SbcC